MSFHFYYIPDIIYPKYFIAFRLQFGPLHLDVFSYVKFDLKSLIRVAEEAAGLGACCIEVSKLPEGNFNKTFLVTMRDELQVIARIPNPNAGRPHYTIASEVATMDYVLHPTKLGRTDHHATANLFT